MMRVTTFMGLAATAFGQLTYDLITGGGGLGGTPNCFDPSVYAGSNNAFYIHNDDANEPYADVITLAIKPGFFCMLRSRQAL